MSDERKAVRRAARAVKDEAAELRASLTGVPLAEFAAQLGADPETAATYVGRENIISDWAGRPCVPYEIAAQAISSARAEQASLNAKQQAYDAAAVEFATRRAAHGEEAYRSAHDVALRREIAMAKAGYVVFEGIDKIKSSPQAKSAGRQAREAALAEWDAKHGGA